MLNRYTDLVVTFKDSLKNAVKGLDIRQRQPAKTQLTQNQKLIEENRALRSNNYMYRESLGHIMSLYQFINIPRLGNSLGDLYKGFAHYASGLSKSSLAFVWISQPLGFKRDQGKSDMLWVHGDTTDGIEGVLIGYMLAQWPSIQGQEKPMELNIRGTRFLAMNIKTATENHGVIGIQTDTGHEDYELCLMQLHFLSGLLGMLLDEQYHKGMEERLIITGEQDRIANEIHDSVSQRLFSVGCSITAMLTKSGKGNQELKGQLGLVKRSIDQAMAELRSTIYNLSLKKRGIKPFTHMIKEYLDIMGRLHAIDVNVFITGDEDLVSSRLKRAIYRIITESAGNAVRHGHCQQLNVNLRMSLPKIMVSIEDDGGGFDRDGTSESAETGLGLRNMRNLVLSFNGDMDIDSQIGRRTRILIRLPTKENYSDNMEGSAI